jgi:predicted metal-dependent phosphoesterase TrpH
LTPEVTIHKIKNQGGIVYVPHPYDEKRQKTVMPLPDLERNILLIDCVECYNGRNSSEGYRLKQTEVAERLNGIKVIGSDAHTFFEIGRNYMDLENGCVTRPEYFLSEVQKAKFHEASCIMAAHRITKLAKAVKLISKGDIYGLFRTINAKLRGGMP